MIERYTNPEMGHLWSIENEWQQILGYLAEPAGGGST